MSLFCSTRGAAPDLDFAGVVGAGLAIDGGLYVPKAWPNLPVPDKNLPYADFAAQFLAPLVGDSFSPQQLQQSLHAAYASFRHADIVPLRRLDENLWLLELFHGPTLAFKDIALQWLGQVFAALPASRRILVLGATSGDTGSAALAGCATSTGTTAVILYPQGRPSDVQRRQMTTLPGQHLHPIAIDGSFDDCQAIVKKLLNDADMHHAFALRAVNSINFARVAAQMVYYARVVAQIPQAHFVVPTGNFGNVYAAYAARRCGVALGGLHIASNANDALPRLLNDGVCAPQAVQATLSPSMDIQIPSNLERWLFEQTNRDSVALKNLMSQALRLPAHASKDFSATSISDAQTLAAMQHAASHYNVLLDPHTAVGYAAYLRAGDKTRPTVLLACAHPAKFAPTVYQATGQHAVLPPEIAEKLAGNEKIIALPAAFAAVKDYILAL